MAFSFRIGTKWCHDFPKLAKESGFYFNMHRSRVGVDWNRINNIDIDRIIRERDFYSIDDNINNVIDYCLESEYDVKILDPNFVKLFRLAQLAVEYLLYCKQYLDHSIIILKDELKLKIEENIKFKKEIATLEEVVKHMKEKREKSKLIETRIGDCSGEIYKCPHCPKTFISPMFVNAHVLRRHAYATDLYIPPSPTNDHYRNETERLHNQIKNLKEKLNETERVKRNESEKVAEKKTLGYDRKQNENEVENFKYVNNKSEEHPEYKEYQEEIKNLRTMLSDEIHNLRQKEKTMYERTSESNVQTLINQQEREFQKLKNQLLEKLTPDMESMNAKLRAQESYWMSKIEHLEKQHYRDVEKLTTELKLTQQVADGMKAEYETKVNNLEIQTTNQSKMLVEQSKQLHSLSHEINISQLNEKNNSPKRHSQFLVLDRFNEIPKKSDENNLKETDCIDIEVEHIAVENNTIDSATNSNLSNKVFPLSMEDRFLKNTHTTNSKNKTNIHGNRKSIKQKDSKNKKIEHVKNVGKELEYYSSSEISNSEDLVQKVENNYEHKKHNISTIRTDLNESTTSKFDDTFNRRNTFNEILSDIENTRQSKSLEDSLSSVTNSDSSVSDSDTESVTAINNNNAVFREYKTQSPFSLKSKKTNNGSFYKKLRANLKEVFEQKLRDLGIDPEWQGIPKATFKQKMDILKHRHKLAVKKAPKYHQIKLKIIQEILDKISTGQKVTENLKQSKKSPTHKVITGVQSTAVKELDQRDRGDHVPTLRTVTLNKSSTPEHKRTIKKVIENETLPVKDTKSESYRTIDRLMQISSSSIKSTEDTEYTTNSLEHSRRKNPSNKMKSSFSSEILELTPNDRSVSSDKIIENSKDNSNMHQDIQNIFISPKHNKSVLKSTSSSTGSFMKKKVIFDLTNEKVKKSSSSDDDVEKEELNETNWNTSNSDERRYVSESEDYKSSSNIILKTTQSDKIAELSRKLEAQLNMVRQKPVGSVETIFTSKYMQNNQNQNKSSDQINSTSVSSMLNSPFQVSASDSKWTNSLPQPAPRNLKEKMSEPLHAESISEASDLDYDIDKILKL